MFPLLDERIGVWDFADIYRKWCVGGGDDEEALVVAGDSVFLVPPGGHS